MQLLPSGQQNLPDDVIDLAAQVGRSGDTAQYLIDPQFFTRPWISVVGGPAFVWPGGIEGFEISVDPTLGIHKYIGDNAVEVDVVHKGQENVILSGTFPGSISAKAMQVLRDIVYQNTPEGGKLLFLPHMLPAIQRVAVANARFSHSEGDMTQDISYSIEFVRIGITNKRPGLPAPFKPVPNPSSGVARGKAKRIFTVTATVNTLRKIAKFKLGDTGRWYHLYGANAKWFKDHNIRQDQAPDRRLPVGTKLHY